MLSLTDTPTCCCLYSTGVWKQAPTHFLIQAGSLTPCLPLASGFHAENYSAFSMCYKFPAMSHRMPSSKTLLVWCPSVDMGKTFLYISFTFHNRTGLKSPQRPCMFCKLLILLKDSKISKTSTHLHSWIPVLKAELDAGAQIASRTIFWWE